jgi:hypothetical protein
MSIFDTYGLKTDDLEQAKTWVEPVIGYMEPHENSYIGKYYLLIISSDENYKLQPNFCDSDFTEEDYQHCGMLLYINQSPRGDEIRESLLLGLDSKIEFIGRVVYTMDGLRREFKYVDGKDILVSERNQASFSYG